MQKKIFIITSIILIGFVTYFLMMSFTQGTGLGKCYYYYSKYDVLDTGYPKGAVIYKSPDKRIIDDIVIYGNVEACNYNNNYIIAKQKPDSAIALKSLEEDLIFWKKYYEKNGIDNTKAKLPYHRYTPKQIYESIKDLDNNQLSKHVDSIFINTPFYKNMFKNKENYFIMDKENDNVIGPLDIKEFTSFISKKRINLEF